MTPTEIRDMLKRYIARIDKAMAQATASMSGLSTVQGLVTAQLLLLNALKNYPESDAQASPSGKLEAESIAL